jgi:hemoglobin-like flavoprotein
MTPDQIVLVQDSFEQLLPAADALADTFYTQLFNAAPQLRELFPADLTEQRRKFLTSLQAVVDALWRPSDLLVPLGELGARHVGYGVRPEHYVALGEALIEALRRELGSGFSPELEAAWLEAYSLVAVAMGGRPPMARERAG